MKDKNSFIIPIEVIQDNRLYLTDKILYSYIEFYCRGNDKICDLSNKQLSEFLDVTTKTISSGISNLKKYNYIIQTFFDGRTRKLELVKLKNTIKKINTKYISLNKNYPEYVYFIKNNNLIKIGKSKNIKNRINDLKKEKPNIVFCIAISTYKSYNLEKIFHNYFINKKVEGEWFDISINDIETSLKDLKIKKEDIIYTYA
jgi:hypothetical protein